MAAKDLMRMESFEPKAPSHEEARVRELADLAESLASGFDLKRAPNAHVWKALDSAAIKDPDGRKKWFALVKAELEGRKAAAMRSRQEYGSTHFTDAQMRRMLKEAEAMEARHPKDKDEEDPG